MGKVSEMVEAAECIANNNRSWNGEKLYDIDNHFSEWKQWVRDRMFKLYGDKANF